MADPKLKGIYATVTALNQAHSTGNTKNDEYLVGTDFPYHLYVWDGSKFVKVHAVSWKDSDLDLVSIENVTSDFDIEQLYQMRFTGDDGKPIMIRQRPLHIGEIEMYVPNDDVPFSIPKRDSDGDSE